MDAITGTKLSTSVFNIDAIGSQEHVAFHAKGIDKLRPLRGDPSIQIAVRGDVSTRSPASAAAPQMSMSERMLKKRVLDSDQR